MSVARFVVSVLGALVVAAGCSTQSHQAAPPSQTPSSSTTSPTAAPPPTTAIQFDPQWMALDTTQPWNWEESDRRITSDFQQFGFRPVDETEVPRRCNGCGVKPPTAFLTVYAPGKFDSTDARTGEPVSVNPLNNGFFRATQGSEDALLAWEYEPNAWATVRGRTTVTSQLDRMLELAHAIRPAERTPIRVPLSLPGVPAPLSLAEIDVDRGDYGTTLEFAKCGMTDVGGTPDCFGEADRLRVQIWPDDGYYGHIQEKSSVPIQIGGKDGIYAEHGAAVQVQPGMLVVFNLGGPFGNPPKPPTASLKGILAGVEWSPDPGNEATWLPVSDWAKQH